MAQLSDTSFRNDANLKGYWKFEADGTDELSGANTVTGTNSPTFVAGKYGNGTDLERTSSQYFVKSSPTAALQQTGDLTINVWAKFESVPASGEQYAFCSMRDKTTGQMTYSIYQWNNGGTQSLLFQHRNSTPTLENDSVAWTPSTATWYMITATISGNSLQFYVNGAAQGSAQTISNTRTHNASAKFIIGAEEDPTPTHYFDGILDDASIFNRALSAAEVLVLYQEIAGGGFPIFFGNTAIA